MKNLRKLNYTLSVLTVLFICYGLAHAQIDTPKEHYAYAVDLMKNMSFETAKVEFIKIIHMYEQNEYQDDARYHLGKIAFKEGNLEVALSQWERLKKNYPKSSYIADVNQKLTLVSELLAKEKETEVRDIAVKKLFDNADFFLEHKPILTVDTSFLDKDRLALEWYKKIVERYPNSQYAPKALYYQILVHYGWGEKGIGRDDEPKGFGFKYHLTYMEDIKSEERLRLVKADLEKMVSLLNRLEKKYPDSYYIVPANFIVGQACYYIVPANFIVGQAFWEEIAFPRTKEISAKTKAIKYFKKVIEFTKDNEFSLYKQIAQERIKRLQQAVVFPDLNLEIAIRETINKSVGVILESDLKSLTALKVPKKGIEDLTGLEYCTNLQDLNLNDNQISDLTPLSNLTNLTELWLGWNQIKDISPLSSLTNLTKLGLNDNQITDISPLTNLSKLGNNLSDGETALTLSNNQIRDLQPLVDNPGIDSGDDVEVRDNPLSYISQKTHIPTLEERGVDVYY